MKNKNLELLAPAGNLEKLKTALAFGADAVYAGIPEFSLRVRINDFNLVKIKEAAVYCHKLNKKIYITINIFAHNKHLKKLPSYVKKLKEYKIDGIIISDLGILLEIKKIWPKVEIHLSTQANCTNWQAVKFWEKQGVKRIILGRETTLSEIKEIHKKCPQMELEYFVHGAMCMAYSGRCFLSKYFTNRSANLGDCSQPCRWKYKSHNIEHITHSYSPFIKGGRGDFSLFISEESRPEELLELIEEEHGSYILNSKDLCLIKHLKELADAGITSFKIEGRAKSVYYQAVVCGIYRSVLDYLPPSYLPPRGDLEKKPPLLKGVKGVLKEKINFLYNELNTKLVHRGYTNGFLFGEKADQNINDSHQKSQWEFCGQTINLITHNAKHITKNNSPFVKGGRGDFSDKKFLSYIKVHNSLKVGDEIEIVRPNYDIIKMKINKLTDAKTKEDLQEAHGGQGKVILLESDFEIPEYSVLRRKIN